ncbi:glycosyltransferase family 2 protein [Psychrobacter cibarius]|uniref:glycosyltransferase family 2 protein n=1 Tax=Psychrobacter cibarius TaxID=282669 RepID=UPI0018DEF2A8|nr:glycosyltransferase family 2 protein [Psychrobacter cibarius]
MLENVSIVIPSYRSEKLISRTILSILDAGVLPSNIFVIEDGIFDNTGDVLREISGINHISYAENKGATYARNLGLSKVETKYVMFIDSDDFVSESLISGLVTAAEKENSDIAFGPWRRDGDSIPEGELCQPPSLSTSDWIFHWIKGGFVATCSVLWKTSKVLEIGGWDESLIKDDDGELAVRGLISTNSLSISTQGYSTYWQHNSAFRVSSAPIEDQLFTSNIKYNNILNWIKKDKSLNKYKVELGLYCYKAAWNARARGLEKESVDWLSRARDLGYKSNGFNNKTKLLSTLFGFRYGALIYSNLLPINSKIKTLKSAFRTSKHV